MQLLNLALNWLLDVVFWMFLGRFVVDIILSMNPGFRPRGIGLALLEIVLTVTDWPMRKIRRLIKPIRIGGGYLDFSWTIALILISVLKSLVNRFIF